MRTAKQWVDYVHGRGPEAPDDNPMNVHWTYDGITDEDFERVIAAVQQDAARAALAAMANLSYAAENPSWPVDAEAVLHRLFAP